MAQVNSISAYRCSHCSRGFARSEHLLRHERTHTKEKPYECSTCRRTFSRSDLLRRHEKKEHQYRWRNSSKPAESMQSTSKPVVDISMSSLACPNIADTDRNVDQFEDSTLIHGQVNPFLTSVFEISDVEMAWANEHPVDLSSPDYELNPSIQDCFLPDDLDWLDNFQQNPHLLESQDFSMPISQHPAIQRRNLQPSILSRPTSPPPHEFSGENESMAPAPARHHVPSISIIRRQKMQADIHKVFASYVLPSPTLLSAYLHRYFKSFHRHQPFLHESTWSPEDAPTHLILAICANGALYSLERKIAVDLHQAAVIMLEREETGICVLQSLMLLMAFSAWGGSPDDLKTALHLHGWATLLLRKSWDTKPNDEQDLGAWNSWCTIESLKRITYCLFTLMGLMDIAYDIPSSVALENRHGLPCHESQWCATTERHWNTISEKVTIWEWEFVEGVVSRLGDESLPTPSGIGMFGCHVIIMTLLQKIISFRRSCSSENFGFSDIRQHYLKALKRWQLMWETEPEASLSPDHPQGPILFNCTAILRVAYIRLVADFSPIRAAFSFSPSAEEIECKIEGLAKPIRNPQTTRAALQACLALRIPVRLGFKVVARTTFWIWSVQHALCYFECALLLANWLEVVQNSQNLSDDEAGVLKLVEEVLSASQADENISKDCNAPKIATAVLISWARLLDTADTTVWKIMPKMAQVLRLHAARLQQTNPS